MIKIHFNSVVKSLTEHSGGQTIYLIMLFDMFREQNKPILSNGWACSNMYIGKHII